MTNDTLTCYLCKRTGHTSAHCKYIAAQNTTTLENQDENTFAHPETQSINIRINYPILNKSQEISEPSLTPKNNEIHKDKNHYNLSKPKRSVYSHTSENSHTSTYSNKDLNELQFHVPNDTHKDLFQTSTISPNSPNNLTISSIITHREKITKEAKIRFRSNSSNKVSSESRKKIDNNRGIFHIQR